MENGIELEKKGLCKDCPAADLETEYFTTADGKHWCIVCRHAEACERIARILQKGEK